ncbi:MAG: glutamate-1-semialdehyde 2,1-aminomutase [Chlamydiales bacterium]
MIKQRLKSEQIYRDACRVTPFGVNSPVRAFIGLNQKPMIIDSGNGDRITDVDGNTYIDFCCSWGALIHGHAHPFVTKGVQQQVERGSSFGISTAVETKLAQMVNQCVPSVEKVRFVSSGTEATMSAVRLARGFTKRDLLIKFSGHYHGHADPFLVEAGSSAATISSSVRGIPSDVVKHTLSLPYNNVKVLEETFSKYGEQIAAVIIEPIAANMGVVPPKDGYLEFLREKTHDVGAVLIFDEVITGFRVALGGAQELYQIKPDLTCFGKIIGGGFPAAAFGGRSEIMDYLAPVGPVYQAGTLSGNPVAMEAGLRTLEICATPGFYDRIANMTSLLTDPICEAMKTMNGCLYQVGSLFTLFLGQKSVQDIEDVKKCDSQAFSRYFDTLFEQGIYISPSQFEANFISSVHNKENLERARDCILAFLK